MPTVGVRGYLIASLAVAVLSASTGHLLGTSDYAFLRVSEALDVLWLGIVVMATFSHGRRGLLTLIGAPLVMHWPVGLRLLDWLCNHGYNARI